MGVVKIAKPRISAKELQQPIRHDSLIVAPNRQT